ncbi:unnamed protein product [Arabidopsis lyrata]|uniref:uncharacterized protein LOC9326799 n=1 Tax=Arabidopsis lyrata subsp. lyrata TaxID=81972 RepID=UPI000A29A840|nr:uncharacterized protein LOC9326799 [Arabidopsis lyrata subsp. lyrata]CAH8253698.1 unnamed protein product [Arabidopsis lyrata]|eukprot:XP_020866861.1 uncharacterized protein LOC9326799 [Arabidopsis lyrata subsp. lyrata]
MTGGESAKVNITCNDSVVEILDPCSLAKVSRKISEIVKKSSDSKIFCTLDVSSEIMRKLVTYCVKRNYQPESDPDKPFSTEDEKWIREEFSKEEEDPKKLFDLYKASEYLRFLHLSALIRRMGMKNSIFFDLIHDHSEQNIKKGGIPELMAETYRSDLQKAKAKEENLAKKARNDAKVARNEKRAEVKLRNKKHLKQIKPFLERLIPKLDDQSYMGFALASKACSPLASDIQARRCLPLPETGSRGIEFTTSDKKTCSPNKEVIALSGYLRATLLLKSEQVEAGSPVKFKVPFTMAIFRRITRFCTLHAKATNPSEKWFAEVFLKKEDDSKSLLDLGEAALYLNIRILVDLIASTVVKNINSKKVSEMRATLHIENDFTDSTFEELERRRTHGDWFFAADPLPFTP